MTNDSAAVDPPVEKNHNREAALMVVGLFLMASVTSAVLPLSEEKGVDTREDYRNDVFREAKKDKPNKKCSRTS